MHRNEYKDATDRGRSLRLQPLGQGVGCGLPGAAMT